VRVLIADDDYVCREIVQAILRKLGHDVATADNGQAAWALLQATGADVIISDWQMSGLNGLQLCERVRSSTDIAYPYFILLTAHGEPQDILLAMQAGVDDHLQKPPSEDELQARLIAAARVTGLHAELADRHQRLASANEQLLEGRRALEMANASLHRLAHSDSLTGLRNRLALTEDMAAIQDRFERYGHGFGIAMLDIDHFKRYNDDYGHQAGDRLIAEVGTAISSGIRPGDLAYRYGGEEFLIVYPDQTIAKTAIAVHRIRQRIQMIASSTDLTGEATLSAGIAAARPPDRFEDIVGRADRALYEAKRGGRNRVCVDSPQMRRETPSSSLAAPSTAQETLEPREPLP